MSTQSHSTPSREELEALYHELGSWKAVGKLLGLSTHQIHSLKRQLGIPTKTINHKPSQLAPHHDQIAALAARGLSCSEIVRELRLAVRPEQVRRYLHRHGIPLLTRQGGISGEKNYRWRGGRMVNGQGYVYVKTLSHPHANRQGYVREHRLVMEQKLGRYLKPWEVVHHINGDRSDNDPANLELYSSNAEHLAETRKGHAPNWSEDGKRRLRETVWRPGRKPVLQERSQDQPAPTNY